MRHRSAFTALLSAMTVLLVACEQRPTSTPELQSILARETAFDGVSKDVWADVRAFYAAREATLAWVVEDGPNERTVAALDALRSAEQHGLDPADYREPQLRALYVSLVDGADDDAQEQLARLDVGLTSALLQLGRHVATGRLEPKVIDGRWNTQREPPDYVTALQQATVEDAATFLDRVQPRHPDYRTLRHHLASLRRQAQTGWPTVPVASMKIGRWNADAVLPLRLRLAASGDLNAAAPLDSPQYDAQLASAVQRFQERHGLPGSGVLDRATVAQMNVPLDRRITQVMLNLERWRWLPDDLGSRHFIVNVPQFHVIARENGAPALEMRVVVGKRGNETPLFADEMEVVVFSPYWNIPETIATDETAPALARDPDYLARNNMEIVDAEGNVVSPDAIPWDDEGLLEGYRFRQRPGPGNALGYVKFLFPNRYAIYLHDTPADALFKRIGRAFSHGCVRVEEPQRLAQYVLRDQAEWTPDAIRTAMRAGTERHVRLSTTIPIYIVYFTAWVDPEGNLHFQDDVYGYDARQARRS